MKIINIALPVELREQGNQFSRCVGMGPEDDRTFSHGPNFVNASGEEFIFTSGWVVDHFAEMALGELVEPEWGCDLAAAQSLQAVAVMGEPAVAGSVSFYFGEVSEALALFQLIAKEPPEDDE